MKKIFKQYQQRVCSILFVCIFMMGYAGAQRPHTVDFTTFCINDFHGAFIANPAQAIPGAPSVLHCVDSLKQLYPHHLTVAAGDNFGGSYFYNATKGVMLPVFFNELGINISALGNHEFDDGQASLTNKWRGLPMRPKDWDITYVCANVFKDKKYLPFEQPFAVREVQITPQKKLKVAFVGLLASSAKEQIRSKNIVGLEFSGRYREILDSLKKESSFAPVRDAHVRTLLLHIGSEMKDNRPIWHDKNAKNLYSINDPFYHAVLSGHSHDLVCGDINKQKYPITQGVWHGMYINVMHYAIDTLSMKVVDVKPEIVKVPFTPKERLSGRALQLSKQIDSLLVNTKTDDGVAIGTQLTIAKANYPHDRSNKYVESEMGRLVCSAYSETFRAAEHLGDKAVVVGVSHFGSIRAGFVKGKVSVLEVGEALPFSNALKVYEMKGKDLLKLLEFGYNNQRYGWIQCSNLKVIRNAEGHVTKAFYVSPKGKKRVIKKNTKCYVVADEFMTNGGDGYSPKFFPQTKLIEVELPSTTSAFINFLSKQESI